MWHVSSRSGVATLRTAIHLLLVTIGLYKYKVKIVCIELSINMQDTPTTDSRGVLLPLYLVHRRSSSLYSLTAISHRHSTQDTGTTVLSSCAGGVNWALTVESYTVFICQQSYLLLIGIPSPTHSFVPGLKPSFSANPSHCSRSFLLLKYLLRGFPGLFTVISEHICFLLLVFSSSVFTLFSCRFRAAH